MKLCAVILKARTHDATLRAMARLHLVSTPEIVARNMACNIAAVESRSTSATLHTTNCVKHVAHNIARNVAPCVRALMQYCNAILRNDLNYLSLN